MHDTITVIQTPEKAASQHFRVYVPCIPGGGFEFLYPVASQSFHWWLILRDALLYCIPQQYVLSITHGLRSQLTYEATNLNCYLRTSQG